MAIFLSCHARALLISTLLLASAVASGCGHSTGSPGDDDGGSVQRDAEGDEAEPDARSDGEAPTDPGLDAMADTDVEGGSAAGDAGGQDATSADARVSHNKSKFSACVDYLTQYCKQRYLCFGWFAGLECENQKQLCPDVFFSPGTRYTPDDLLDCAPQWAQYSCADLSDGMAPSCYRAGTLANDAPCIYANQCASGRCTGTPGSCGKCIAPQPLGTPCTQQICERGAICAYNMCSTRMPARRPGRAREGEPCTDSEGCVTETWCTKAADSPTGYRCVHAGAGISAGTCAPEAYVPRTSGDHVCQALPGLNQGCADSSGTLDAYCAADTWCDSWTDTCLASKQLGESCSGSQGDCLAGLQCAEYTPQGPGTCLRYQSEGDSCSGKFERCVRGTACTAGVCRAPETQGVYEKACAL
jgi:hypothetical protein